MSKKTDEVTISCKQADVYLILKYSKKKNPNCHEKFKLLKSELIWLILNKSNRGPINLMY